MKSVVDMLASSALLCCEEDLREKSSCLGNRQLDRFRREKEKEELDYTLASVTI